MTDSEALQVVATVQATWPAWPMPQSAVLRMAALIRDLPYQPTMRGIDHLATQLDRLPSPRQLREQAMIYVRAATPALPAPPEGLTRAQRAEVLALIRQTRERLARGQGISHDAEGAQGPEGGSQP